MPQTIFIGGASEERPRQMAEQLAAALTAASFTPKPWWTTFKPGDYALDRLLEESEGVNGSVFIWTSADKSCESWSVECDRRAKVASYTHGERRWLATGVSRRTGESIDKVAREFVTRMSIRQGKSDVVDTYTKLIFDIQSENSIFIAAVRSGPFERMAKRSGVCNRKAATSCAWQGPSGCRFSLEEQSMIDARKPWR